MPPPPPTFLPTSALSLELDAFVAVTAAFRAGVGDARASFECTLPEPPADYGFLVLAGVEPLLDALERFKLKNDELTWLESLGAVDPSTKKRLADIRFTCDVSSVTEGSVVFPGEPVLSVEGPFWQAQLLSALVRGALGLSTLAATKAARCVLAAGGCEVIESSAATAHRLGGNPLLARAAYIGGAHGTTSALAARRYRIPVRASLPLRFALAVPDASAAFEAWLTASQDKAILRLDHRDPVGSIASAIAAVKRRAAQPTWNDAEVAIEIGGGDLLELSRAAVGEFRAAGLPEPVVVASGALDESRIAELRRQAAPIAAFVVSSFGFDDASFMPQYDLVALETDGQWSPRMRAGRSLALSSDPGRKFVVRYADAEGRPLADVVCATNERIPTPRDVRYTERATGFARRLQAVSSAQLLTNMMRGGKRVSAAEKAASARDRAMKNVLALPERYRRIRGPALYPVGATNAVVALKGELTAPQK